MSFIPTDVVPLVCSFVEDPVTLLSAYNVCNEWKTVLKCQNAIWRKGFYTRLQYWRNEVDTDLQYEVEENVFQKAVTQGYKGTRRELRNMEGSGFYHLCLSELDRRGNCLAKRIEIQNGGWEDYVPEDRVCINRDDPPPEDFKRLTLMEIVKKHFFPSHVIWHIYTLIQMLLVAGFLALVVDKLNNENWNRAGETYDKDIRWLIPFSALYLSEALTIVTLIGFIVWNYIHILTSSQNRVLSKVQLLVKIFALWSVFCITLFSIFWHLRLTFPNWERELGYKGSFSAYRQVSYVFGSGVFTLCPLYLLNASFWLASLFCGFLYFANYYYKDSSDLVYSGAIACIGTVLSLFFTIVLFLWTLKWELDNYISGLAFNWSYVFIPLYIAEGIVLLVAFIAPLGVIGFTVIQYYSWSERLLYISTAVAVGLFLDVIASFAIIWQILVSIEATWKFSYILLTPYPVIAGVLWMIWIELFGRLTAE